MEEKILQAVHKALKEAGSEMQTVALKRPPEIKFGDYAVFVGPEHAAAVAESVQKSLGDAVEKVEVAGPGFINITLSREAIALVVSEADAQGTEWGESHARDGQRVMVEYTDPNPFKEMHIGHLMSNAIGESIARLVEASGAKV